MQKQNAKKQRQPNEMTQIERNFGTKALRRDGVRCDTQGGRALLRVSDRHAWACEAARFISLIVDCRVKRMALRRRSGEETGRTANKRCRLTASFLLTSILQTICLNTVLLADDARTYCSAQTELYSIFTVHAAIN